MKKTLNYLVAFMLLVVLGACSTPDPQVTMIIGPSAFLRGNRKSIRFIFGRNYVF